MKTFEGIWEERYKNLEGSRYPTIEAVRFIYRNYADRFNVKLKGLDLGCGAGANHAWLLAKEEIEAYAIDGSETAVIRAKQSLYR